MCKYGDIVARQRGWLQVTRWHLTWFEIDPGVEFGLRSHSQDVRDDQAAVSGQRVRRATEGRGKLF